MGHSQRLYSRTLRQFDIPIYCRFGPVSPATGSRAPFTEFDNWEHPSKIIVHLSVNTPVYSQFVYQLGHQLGHVMLDPRRSNGLIDTIYTALSYEVLDGMTDQWQNSRAVRLFAGIQAELCQIQKI